MLPLKDNRDELSKLNKILDKICQIHSTPGKPANHTHRDCWVFKQSGRLNAEHKGLDALSEDDDEPHQQSAGKQNTFPQEVKTVNSLHVTKGKNRTAPTKIRAIWPAPEEHRHWLLQPITFDHQDYSKGARNAGWTALVVNPIINGLQFTKVLMDGGSDLKLLYQDTIRKLGVNPAIIRHGNTSFQGVTPGPDTQSMGSLSLEVTRQLPKRKANIPHRPIRKSLSSATGT